MRETIKTNPNNKQIASQNQIKRNFSLHVNKVKVYIRAAHPLQKNNKRGEIKHNLTKGDTPHHYCLGFDAPDPDAMDSLTSTSPLFLTSSFCLFISCQAAFIYSMKRCLSSFLSSFTASRNLLTIVPDHCPQNLIFTSQPHPRTYHLCCLHNRGHTLSDRRQ